jgi:hypothetical protein
VGWGSAAVGIDDAAGSGKQGFNGFVAENDERCHGSGPLGDGLVSCGVADRAYSILIPRLASPPVIHDKNRMR